MLDNFTPDTARMALMKARCPFLVKGDKCSETERLSGRIKTCPREYGYGCEEYNKTHCPTCGLELEHFSGLEKAPDYDYCNVCLDWAYQDGKKLFRLI